MYFNTVKRFRAVHMRSNLNEDQEKMKTISKKIFKVLLIVASLCGFIYQVSNIYDQFMSGRTIVSIEIGRIADKSMPAITVCFDGLYSMERAAINYPEFRKLNETYWDIIMSKYSSEASKFKAEQFYESAFKNLTKENFKTKASNMNELFDSFKYSNSEL